jgi:hypothetical protein
MLALYKLCEIHIEFGLMFNNLVFTGHRSIIHIFPDQPLVFERPLPDANCNLLVLYEVCLSQRPEFNSVMIFYLNLKFQIWVPVIHGYKNFIFLFNFECP